eukprot:CAMPEP_0174289540 /NCGR_PEP_ID=MMETSP0809-20121228/25430_1 /TAXON_ID=73025 ORGANISM="Eutreptiella gymnastica-like, Strain CCMP1594" /NCGR_SAMPLE_ID=MMETSP0809 /ASSEMBLY_ACC=CAM_ASM_000658 /LENGTH=41 /DNA_ID= /DNA_START= /DNA_END= /DNA_ORIENTATION=
MSRPHPTLTTINQPLFPRKQQPPPKKLGKTSNMTAPQGPWA